MDYQGSCQCGAVRFRVETTLDGAVTCNCSRCQRLGAVFVFAPRAAFVLEAGADATTEYLFNRHAISHRFCRTCGIEPFAFGSLPDGAAVVAVNVNGLEGVDPRAVAATARHIDGRSL